MRSLLSAKRTVLAQFAGIRAPVEPFEWLCDVLFIQVIRGNDLCVVLKISTKSADEAGCSVGAPLGGRPAEL